jgi:anti-anti-sigma regulatory factor
MSATILKIDPERVADSLRQLHAKLDAANGETVLDFCSVRRIDAKAVQALEDLAGLAEAKGSTIALRNVHVEIYKVLKLVKLAPRFSLLT